MAVYYAGKLRAAKVGLTQAASHIWFRFENLRGAHHLLFQPRAQESIREGFAH